MEQNGIWPRYPNRASGFSTPYLGLSKKLFNDKTLTHPTSN